MKFRTITPSSMNRPEFIATFKDIYEHSPWVAEQAFQQKTVNSSFDDIEALHQLMSDILMSANKERQLALINAHPDLAGRAAVQGELTAASTAEQAGAGIQECTADEFMRFTSLNNTYKAKFNFPFIMAVRGSNRFQILDAFEKRIHHDIDTEFKQALIEINKIALFRLETL